MHLHKCKLKCFEEKVPGKDGEYLFDSYKYNSFWDPKCPRAPAYLTY